MRLTCLWPFTTSICKMGMKIRTGQAEQVFSCVLGVLSPVIRRAEVTWLPSPSEEVTHRERKIQVFPFLPHYSFHSARFPLKITGFEGDFSADCYFGRGRHSIRGDTPHQHTPTFVHDSLPKTFFENSSYCL